MVMSDVLGSIAPSVTFIRFWSLLEGVSEGEASHGVGHCVSVTRVARRSARRRQVLFIFVHPCKGLRSLTVIVSRCIIFLLPTGRIGGSGARDKVDATLCTLY